MPDTPQAVIVRDNPAESRYETQIDGHTAFAAYTRQGNEITFTHTEVPAELSGGGIAGRIVSFALDDARQQGLGVIPLCPYVVSYIKRHPEYRDLVLPAYQDRVQ